MAIAIQNKPTNALALTAAYEAAIQRGYVVLAGGGQQAYELSALWAARCYRRHWPIVELRRGVNYSNVSLDVTPTGKTLSEFDLHEAFNLLTGLRQIKAVGRQGGLVGGPSGCTIFRVKNAMAEHVARRLVEIGL